MFEPQDHPNDFQYPGGPPIPPYDNAGWTLAFQMGLKFDRVLDGVRRSAREDRRRDQAGRRAQVTTRSRRRRLRRAAPAQRRVHRRQPAAEGGRRGALRRRSQLAEHRRHRRDLHRRQAVDGGDAAEGRGSISGSTFTGVTSASRRRDSTSCAKPRIALWDQYGGSMPSGHVRWLLEQFEFDFEVVYPADARRRQPQGEVRRAPVPRWRHPRDRCDGGGGGFGGRQPHREEIPEEYRAHLGRVTLKHDGPAAEALRRRRRRDRRVRRIGRARSSPRPAGERSPRGGAAGRQRAAAARAPSTTSPDRCCASPSTTPTRSASASRSRSTCSSTTARCWSWRRTRRCAASSRWRGSTHKEPLRSGWAWGQHYLEGGAAALEATLGKGKVFLFGPEITFRAQPHGTFKFLFNSIFYGTAQAVGGPTAETAARGR